MLVPAHQSHWIRRRTSLYAGICVVTGFINLWRFPELIISHGWLNFSLAYCSALLFLAFPVMLLQWRLGRTTRAEPMGALQRLSGMKTQVSLWSVTGGLMLLGCLLTAAIYLLVSGVSLTYLQMAALGDLNGLRADRAADILRSLQSGQSLFPVWVTLVLLPAAVVAARGLVNGHDRSLPVLVWAMAGLTGFLLVTVLAADWRELLGMFGQIQSDDFSVFGLWFDALTLAFFSLALGSGVHFVLGAYMAERTPDLRVLGGILGIDLLVGLAAALLVFPLSLGSEAPVSSGFSLVFQALPVAMMREGYGSETLAALYLLLTLVGLTSLLLLAEPLIYRVQGQYRLHRRSAVALVLGVVWGITMLLSRNMAATVDSESTLPWFTLLQFGVSSLLFPLATLIMLFLLLWVLPRRRLSVALRMGEQQKLLDLLIFWLRWVVLPLVIAIQAAVMFDLLRHGCLVGAPFAGMICRSF